MCQTVAFLQCANIADGLIPFTRWITPVGIPKRFTTQMYLYFLPLSANAVGSTLPSDKEAIIPAPTSDGGLEHTAARFLPVSQWLNMARSGEIMLFPPQFFLMHLLEPFLSPDGLDAPSVDSATLNNRRARAIAFVKSGNPAWTDKCISPITVMKLEGDGRVVLSLDKPGLELKGSGRIGELERVVLANFGKGGPTNVEIAYRKDIFPEDREKGKL